MKAPASSRDSVLIEAGAGVEPRVDAMNRRRLMRMAAGLLPLVGLSGCEVTGRPAVQAALRGVSSLNDRAQAALFSPTTFAQTFSDREVSVPFRFNAYYGEDSVPEIDAASWRLAVKGNVRNPGDWTLPAIQGLPTLTEATRLICIEGWSAIGKWTGVPLHVFLDRIGADTTSKYVVLRCADGYFTSIDMASALHPQTMLAHGFADQPALPDRFGFPLRLRIPTKLGFKNAKHIVEITVTNAFSGGYWEDLQGYNWFAGI
jgi:DMSO/TMAO reductase YedYZ molybdopterin-dependent catalytic subunit